jgi:NAD+ dependent glucose-6-phosphate dehydrogenase
MKTVVLGAAGWLGRAVLANMEGKHEVRAFDRSPQSWEAWKDVDGEWQGEKVHGDIVDFEAVNSALEGAEGVVHTAVLGGSHPGAYGTEDKLPFLVNLKGLWNVLEAARQRGIKRVVHVGSCQTVHPKGIFFTSEVRRPDAGLYGVTKRLQEEMCRQFHDGYGMSIIVLRPDYIVDSRIGMGWGWHREKLGAEGRRRQNGWICRHDLAEACRLALETDKVDFDIFHIIGTPEAEKTCNVARSREVLGLQYRGDLEQYR